MGKSRVSEDCMSAAKAALKTFSEADLEKYVSHVMDKMRSYENVHGTEAVQRAIVEVNDERMQGYMESLQTKVNNAAKYDARAAKITEGKQTLMQTLVRRMDGLGDNVESAQRKSFKRLMDKFFNILTDEEFSFLSSPDHDIDIVRAVDGKPASDMAKAVSDKFKTYIEARNVDMVSSNALPLFAINKDRMLRAIHDAGRMLRGGRSLVQSAMAKKYSIVEAKALWKESIRPLLNLKETFFDTPALDLNGNVNPAEVDKMLDEIFDNITTGKPELLNSGGKGKNNMFFYWKDMESWMTYNKQYGRGNLMNAMRSDIQASANKIGLSEILGDSPSKAYNDLAKLENEVNPQSARKKYQAKLAYNWVAGQDRAPVDPNMASYWSALRALTGGAKLIGRVTFLSIPDIANGIMYAHRWGYGYFKAYGTYLSGMFNMLKTEERTHLAGLFKEITDAHMGYMTRFIDAHDPGQFINNMNTVLYKATLMEALDKGNKLSALQLQSRILGDNSHLEHAALPDKMKSMLDKFNISDNEWNVIRNNTDKMGNKKLFTMDGIDRLTNDDIRKIYGKENVDQPMYQLKNELYRKVYSMFDIASENAVLTPGAFMRSASNFGTRSGTIHGEILRSIMQFKMYPLEFADRVLYQGFKAADGVQSKLIFGALLFASTLPMSWLSIYLDNHLSKGKTMPDWDKMNFGEKTDYSKNLLLPGIGMWGNFFSPDQPWSGAGSIFVTPSIQLLWDSMKLPYRISEGVSEGDMGKVGKAFEKVGRNVIPGIGMPGIAPYMRQMFGDKPYLQPGQEQLYGA